MRSVMVAAAARGWNGVVCVGAPVVAGFISGLLTLLRGDHVVVWRAPPWSSGRRLCPAGVLAESLRSAAARARWRCIRGMVAAPSPTAEATRLTDPRRTSPAANTPGRLVSSGSGQRAGCQRGPLVPGDGLAEPLGARPGADEDEQGVGGDGAPRPGGGVLQYQRLQVAGAGAAGHLHAVADVDVRGGGDL